MDTALFDYKTSQAEQPRKANIKSQQRSIGGQPTKLVYNPLFQNHNDAQQGALPPVGTLGRLRPSTANMTQGTNITIEGLRSTVTAGLQDLGTDEEARLAERNAYDEPIQLSDMMKLMPKNIKVEKEKLYEDTLHLKQNNNALKEDNLKLKTKNLALERENMKLVKTLESFGNTTAQYGKPVESTLLVALKKQTKEAKDDLKTKIDELETVKRNIKFTRVQELETELKVNIEENIRLRAAFEELAKLKPQIKLEDYHKLEQQYYMQANVIENCQREIMRQNADIKYLEEQNFNLQAAREQDIKEAQKQQNELTKVKKKLRDREHRMNSGSSKLDLSGNKTGAAKSVEKIKAEDDIEELRNKLEQKDHALSQREKTIEDLKQKLNEKMGNEMKEKQNYSMENMKLREQYAELEARYRMLLSMHYASEQLRSNGEIPSETRQELFAQGMGVQANEPKISNVTFEDVKTIGAELSMKLRIRRISLDDVLTSLDRFGVMISLNDMRAILTFDPFGLKDENNSILLARYLIEPRDEDVTALDVTRVQALDVIKAELKKVLGSYALINEVQAKEMAEELSEIISAYQEKLNKEFNKLPEAKTGYLSIDQITKAFKDLSIQVDVEAFEYLVMNLYEYTGNLKRLDYMKMFEVFGGNEKHIKPRKTADSQQEKARTQEASPEKKGVPQDNKGVNKKEEKSNVQAAKKVEENRDDGEDEEGIYEDEYDEEDEQQADVQNRSV